jgi:hypothetical protein
MSDMSKNRIPVSVSLSVSLIEILPDLARICKASDEDGYFEDVPDVPSLGALQRMAGEAYDSMKDPKFSREIGTAMIASNLVDSARSAVLAAVCNSVLSNPKRSMDIEQALLVLSPYADPKDDPDTVRGEAVLTLMKALGLR